MGFTCKKEDQYLLPAKKALNYRSINRFVQL